MNYLKRLFDFIFSRILFCYQIIHHICYRCFLFCLSFPLYCRYPRLTILDLICLVEECVRFVLFPIRIVLAIFQSNKSSSPIYGTVSYQGLHQLANHLMLTNYKICDIGSGKGKLLFFYAIVHKCRAIGIESYPFFIYFHRALSFLLGLSKNVTLTYQDILTSPLPKADVYFIVGLGFESNILSYLQDALSSLVSTSIIVSVGVTFPALSTYHKQTISLPCSWGFCDTYIYHCIDSTDKA